MDDRFKNLIRARDLKLAWVLLGLFCVLVLTVSRLSYWVVGFPGTNLMRHSSYLIIGMLIGVACLISVWTTLGEDSLLRRSLFLACSAAAILAAWILGLSASFYPESVRLSGREEIYAMGLLPTAFFALCLPLVVFRWISGFALDDRHGDAFTREPITTANLMIVTALTGCCLAGVRLASVAIDVVLIPLAIVSGCGFVLGLVAVLPGVLLLCSRRRNYLVGSLALNLIGSLLFGGITAGFSKMTGAWISTQDVLAIFEGSLAATATFSVGIGIVRLFGYRLAKHPDARARVNPDT